jgi:hypothetical protein
MAATMVGGKIKATCLLPKKPNFQAISTKKHLTITLI